MLFAVERGRGFCDSFNASSCDLGPPVISSCDLVLEIFWAIDSPKQLHPAEDEVEVLIRRIDGWIPMFFGSLVTRKEELDPLPTVQRPYSIASMKFLFMAAQQPFCGFFPKHQPMVVISKALLKDDFSFFVGSKKNK